MMFSRFTAAASSSAGHPFARHIMVGPDIISPAALLQYIGLLSALQSRRRRFKGVVKRCWHPTATFGDMAYANERLQFRKCLSSLSGARGTSTESH